MGHEARDEIARRFARCQLGFAHCLGHLYLVAYMLLLLFTLALDRVGRVRIVRVLHTVGGQLLFIFGLDQRVADSSRILGLMPLGLARF